jgi:Anti-sigma-K factor rskA
MNGANSRGCPRNEQAVGWALHALEPAEEVGMTRHLVTCASCRNTLAGAERVLARLGASVEQADPPRRLRTRILSRAAEIPQAPPTPASPATPRPPEQAASRGPTGRADRGPWRPQPRVRRGLLVGVSLATAGLLGLSGLGFYTAQVQHHRDAEIVRVQSLADLLVRSGQPGTARATLTTEDGRPIAAVVIADGRGTVVTTGLDPNDRANTIYVVWGMGPDAPHPLGSFDAGPNAGVHPFGAISGFSGYEISLEPGRTMPAAPTTIVATGEVTG